MAYVSWGQRQTRGIRVSEHTPYENHAVDAFAKKVRDWQARLPHTTTPHTTPLFNVHFLNDRAKTIVEKQFLHPKPLLPEDSHLARVNHYLNAWAFAPAPANTLNTKRLIKQLSHEYSHAHKDLEQEKQLVLQVKDELRRATLMPDESNSRFPILGKLLAYIEERSYKYQVKTNRKTVKDYWETSLKSDLQGLEVTPLITVTQEILARREPHPSAEASVHLHTTVQKDHDFAETLLNTLINIRNRPERVKTYIRELQHECIDKQGKHQHKTKKMDRYKKTIADVKCYLLTPSPELRDLFAESLEKAVLPKHARKHKLHHSHEMESSGTWVNNVRHMRLSLDNDDVEPQR